MPYEIYVLHPGVGQNRPSDGAGLAKVDGVNFSYIEQRFIDGVDKRTNFHGIVVPPNLDVGLDVEIEIRWKQRTAAPANNLYANVHWRGIVPPADRDAVPLTALVPQAIPITGGVGEEVTSTFLIPAASFTSGQELLLAVERLGSDLVNDTFTGTVSLVSVILRFPQVGLLGGSGMLVANVSGQVDGVTDTFTVPSYQMGANNLRVFRNGVMEDPSTVTQIDSTTIQLSVVPEGAPDPEYVDVWYLPL